ncbi:MAG: site-specific integrase [Bacilli bacterium]|nr:site-specific integrase [Bacilli bacterium]
MWITQTLRVNKNVVSYIEGKKFRITTPKTKSSNRILPMPDILVNGLKQVYENFKKYQNFNKKWFVFGGVEPISNGKIRTHKISNCNKAKLREIRIHDFRHSCASLLINSGANINMVAKYLGHTKIDETLNTYSHLFKNKMNDIVNIINNL